MYQQQTWFHFECVLFAVNCYSYFLTYCIQFFNVEIGIYFLDYVLPASPLCGSYVLPEQQPLPVCILPCPAGRKMDCNLRMQTGQPGYRFLSKRFPISASSAALHGRGRVYIGESDASGLTTPLSPMVMHRNPGCSIITHFSFQLMVGAACSWWRNRDLDLGQDLTLL